jgi:hypothetical protein
LASPTERRRNFPSRIGSHTTFGGRRSVGAFSLTEPRGTQRSFRFSARQHFHSAPLRASASPRDPSAPRPPFNPVIDSLRSPVGLPLAAFLCYASIPVLLSKNSFRFYSCSFVRFAVQKINFRACMALGVSCLPVNALLCF